MFKIKISTKISLTKLIRWSFAVVLILATLTLGLLVRFLYENLYQAITQVNIIYNLQTEMALETVDAAAFNAVLKNLAEKGPKQEVEWGQIKNPFKTPPPPASP